ncbi:hypothetical protein KAU11_07175 [Candidatus Babeliales bacterium]|nr:hypothetical protein [Candidatus Babeliales bacterium]
MKSWYHDTKVGNTNQIKPFEPYEVHYTPASGCWHGPFKSYSEAKADAIDIHVKDAENSYYAAKRLRKSLKKDWE